MNLKILKKLIIFTLLIINLINPQIVFCDDTTSAKTKVIYLTFDDGPANKVTTKILDILKSESVPATFFLIGEQIKDQEDLVKRMYEEGHSLGLHSMTHKKNCLYSSNDNFLKEMLDTQNLINSILGIKPNILRFPFGCNNNNYKLSPTMVKLLHENNLKIFDWNTDSGDGANPRSSPSKLIKNSISNKDNIILLMHCGYINKNSIEALPSIIKYYKNKGYEFKKIDDNTPEEFRLLNKH